MRTETQKKKARIHVQWYLPRVKNPTYTMARPACWRVRRPKQQASASEQQHSTRLTLRRYSCHNCPHTHTTYTWRRLSIATLPQCSQARQTESLERSRPWSSLEHLQNHGPKQKKVLQECCREAGRAHGSLVSIVGHRLREQW